MSSLRPILLALALTFSFVACDSSPMEMTAIDSVNAPVANLVDVEQCRTTNGGFWEPGVVYYWRVVQGNWQPISHYAYTELCPAGQV